MKLLKGDNLELLKTLEDNSIDSIVTDPPYGLKFMNKKWDYSVPSKEFWEEVYRVLKPGGHVLSFGGTRTYHRMVVNLEDAGFEIRDCISWLYGSGFPKSMNIGKQVDRIQGNEREVVGERELQGTAIHEGNHRPEDMNTIPITKGTSPQEGQGTGLKPAQELICMARKPISEKTITDNVLKWGTGGINVDGCRIGSDIIKIRGGGREFKDGFNGGWKNNCGNVNVGRFPANIILDEEAAKVLDSQSGISKSSNILNSIRKGKSNFVSNHEREVSYRTNFGDKGGASRFFYVAKVSSKERNLGLGEGFEDGSFAREIKKVKNNHPTVKPINLLIYLVRLVTPKGGIVLDPYMGSGSTGIATLLEGFDFIGMELDEDYFKIASARIDKWEEYKTILK